MCKKALLAAFTYALLSQVACVAERSNDIEVLALAKYGEALRASVADAYVYALVKEYDRKVEFSEIEFIEYYPDLSLCNADDSKRISHRALLQKCRVVEYSARQSCRDIDGCIELTVHESIRADEALNSLLLDVLRNPCAYIPVDERFHWSSLYFPNWVSSSNLNCKEGKLPYSKVFLTYGEVRTQISI